MTSQAKTFRTLSRFTRIAVHQPVRMDWHAVRTPELTVLKNSSSVRTVRAMCSTKLISRSNGSSYPFKKIHQPFERARAIRSRKIHQPFERLELSVRENSSAVSNGLELYVQGRNSK